MKEFKVSARIRDTFVPEIQHFASVDVDVTNLGVTLFRYDKLGEETSSDYVSLTRDEAIKLRDFLVKELK